MVRGRKQEQGEATEVAARRREERLDVNAVVSYNLKAIRERRGWTQEDVAQRLSVFTKHRLPQASISAMERGYDGERRRRFDAHELYLFSMVFSVPIVYFFMPPPRRDVTSDVPELADAERPIGELYAAVLGRHGQLEDVDARLADLGMTNPEEVDDFAAALFGDRDAATQNWYDHYRTWRKHRLAELARRYGDRLDEVAEFLEVFANQVKQFGPSGYLQSLAHKPGEDPFDDVGPLPTPEEG